MLKTRTRTSGILLHPTSLPGRWGIGDLGADAYRFVDFLASTGQRLWQVMPLGPTGYGDSPYQSFSAFAGNPLLISPDELAREGLLELEDLGESQHFSDTEVQYGTVIRFKMGLLRRSFERFEQRATPRLREELELFRSANRAWLDDYALFTALKAAHDGASWNNWPDEIARHELDAVAYWHELLREEVDFYIYTQFLFSRQWHQVKRYANQHGIRIIGDIPIFVAYDSADLWANHTIFALDERGSPLVVAGVPPDYFSATGQRWGNPLYRWDVLAQRGYDWWIERFRTTLALFDIVRLDHFRGFAAYWEVPAAEETAINGRWQPGPGLALFEAVRRELGELPVIAEDLGLITPDVEELRNQLGFPGMKVLQFAFGGDYDEPYLPHNYEPDCVVYTGTHDNDTTRGWWNTASDHEHYNAQVYMGRDGTDISWDLIRLALSSVADMAIIPLQDVLNLDSEARMNTPGRAGGNWSWRYTPEALNGHIVERLRMLTRIYGRLIKDPVKEAESGSKPIQTT